MTVMKLSHKHSSASCTEPQSLKPVHVVSTRRQAVVLCAAMVDWPRLLLHGQEVRAQTPLSVSHAIIPVWLLLNWHRLQTEQGNAADRQRWSTRKVHQRSGKRWGSSDVQYVKIYTWWLVLTSSAALGSITPAAREDRKGGGGGSQRVKWRDFCSQKRLLGGRFPPSCFSFGSLEIFPLPLFLERTRELSRFCIISCNLWENRGWGWFVFSVRRRGVWQPGEGKVTD